MFDTPGVERFLGGLLLTLVSIGLCVSSWQMYRTGQPGAPPFADDRVDYGRQSGTTLFLPALSPVERVSTTVRYGEIPEGLSQEIEIELERTEPAPTDVVVPAILIIRDGARMDAISEATNDSCSARLLGLAAPLGRVCSWCESSGPGRAPEQRCARSPGASSVRRSTRAGTRAPCTSHPTEWCGGPFERPGTFVPCRVRTEPRKISTCWWSAYSTRFTVSMSVPFESGLPTPRRARPASR